MHRDARSSSRSRSSSYLPWDQVLKSGLSLEERLVQFLDMAASMTAGARGRAAEELTASVASDWCEGCGWMWEGVGGGWRALGWLRRSGFRQCKSVVWRSHLPAHTLFSFERFPGQALLSGRLARLSSELRDARVAELAGCLAGFGLCDRRCRRTRSLRRAEAEAEGRPRPRHLAAPLAAPSSPAKATGGDGAPSALGKVGTARPTRCERADAGWVGTRDEA